jgi:hypothetical protein
MVQIAREIENSALRRDPFMPAAAHIPSSYAEALDSVSSQLWVFAFMNADLNLNHQIHLTETFLGFAESMRKPRASLMRQSA